MDLSHLSSINNSFTSTYYMVNKETTQANDFEEILNKAAQEKDEEKLKKACNDFESYFLQTMYKSMKQVSFADENGLFGKSNAEKMFQDMLDEETCKRAAESGNGIGLSQMLYKQLSKQFSKTI